MNRSGDSACRVLEELGADVEDLLVVCDDFNLPLGMLRIRTKGSDGGHNGLASIIYQLDSQDFPRLRLGVGPLPPGRDPVEFVLGRFSESEEESLEKVRQDARRAVIDIADTGLSDAMNMYNRRSES
jgi:PTH1 family peptidyl-tRNA hydrolase